MTQQKKEPIVIYPVDSLKMGVVDLSMKAAEHCLRADGSRGGPTGRWLVRSGNGQGQ